MGSEDRLPKSIGELWGSLLWCLLLHKRPEAQVEWFTNEALENGVLSYANVKVKDSLQLREDVLEFIKTLVAKHPKDTMRLGVLEEYGGMFKKDSEFCLINGIKNASDLIAGEVEPDLKGFLISMDEDEKLVQEFVFQLIYPLKKKIHRVSKKKTLKEKYFLCQIGLTKAIVWIHRMGLGNELCTPNSHHLHFLVECGVKKFESYKSYDIHDLRDYSIFNKEMLGVRDELMEKLGKEISLRDLDIAVFYYESSKQLLKGMLCKRNFTPRELINFLEEAGMTLEDWVNDLIDLDKYEKLAEKLREYAKENL